MLKLAVRAVLAKKWRLLGTATSVVLAVAFLSGTLDYYVRAYDVANGEQLWESRLPAGGQATPMTYTGSDGRQFLLVVAGLFEVAWATLLDESKGFSRVLPTVGFVVTLVVSMWLLSVATRTIPIGTGYAVWVGIGAVGAFVVGVLRGHATNPAQVVAMAALVGSIVAVKLTATH